VPRPPRHTPETESADHPLQSDADDRALTRRRRRALSSALVAAVVVAALYIGLPRIAGLDETWGRLSEGDPWWLGVAVLLEGASYGGYVLLFRGIFVGPGSPIGWRESYEITMSGVAATRLLAAGGAGGIALTAWALSRSGMGRAAVVRGLSTFLAALYGVYMLALVLVGAGLRSGLLAGPAPFALTVVPAAFGASAIVVALATSLLPRDLDRRVRARPVRHERLAGIVASAASAAGAIAAGIRGALALLRGRDPALIGAVAWWGCDIGVLWACFHAFGEPPPPAVLVMAYFTGMLGNLLPLPGGVGGVEGGMIAALIGFDVPGGLAVVAVLSYRAFAFWLPTIPGAIAYLQLRRTVEEWKGAPGLSELRSEDREVEDAGARDSRG
jgi:putative heme transporter